MKHYTLTFPSDYRPTARNHPAYPQWATMLTRCRNKKTKKYKSYGARGISVCKRWEVGENGMTGFECFMADMGNKPSRKHSLDRIKNDGNYEPENCRWATAKEQANNRRSNRTLEYNGEKMSMMDLAEKCKISYFVLRNRISRGWSVDDAVNSPLGISVLSKKTAMGSRLPQSKLTEDSVREIRKIHRLRKPSMESLGLDFGVSPASICLIINRKTWRHVD